MNFNAKLILLTLLISVPITILFLKSMGKTNILNGIEYTIIISAIIGFIIYRASKEKIEKLDQIYHIVSIVGLVFIVLFLFFYTIKTIIELGANTESGMFVSGLVILLIIIVYNFYSMYSKLDYIKFNLNHQ